MTLNILTPVPSWESEMWTFMIQLSVIAITLIVGHVLAKEIGFFRKSTIPASVVGGTLLFALQLIPSINNVVDRSFMTIVSYHALGLGFVALTLRKTTTLSKKRVRHKSLKTGMTTVNTYLLQAMIGLVITIIFSVTVFGEIFPGLGVLASMGLGRETSHAYESGKNFIDVYQGAISFAFAISIMGFIVATIGGEIAQRVFRSKGLLPKREEIIKRANELDETIRDEIAISDCADKFSMQTAIVLFVYFLGFLIMYGLSQLAILVLGDFGSETLKPLIFGINFVFGVNAALIFKGLTGKLKSSGILQQDYTNNFMLNRIVGFMFDILIVATIASFDPALFKQLGLDSWLAIILIVTLAVIATWKYLRKVSPILFPGYEQEGFFMMFGNLTGTAGTGMMLLKEIDPKLQTPASRLLTLQSLPAVIIGIPLIILIPFAAQGLAQAIVTLAVLLALFILLNFMIFKLGKKVVN